MQRLRRGFSLLELLLVILLLALLIGGAYGGIRAAVSGMHAGEQLIERVDRVRTVQQFLRHQITRILVFPYAQDQGKQIVFEGSAASMRFVAPMAGYLSHGGAYVQTLELQRGREGMQLVFNSALLNGYENDKSHAADAGTVVLLDRIVDGHFSYLGLDEQGRLTNWGSEWRDARTTPLLVGIDITLPAGSVTWPALTIPLMTDAGARRNFGTPGFR